ncbi:hypothetical protein N0V90_002761 [Kalmusia sp. IMI 367209]|nr:hypothetical protein N0V90_002761 [Kalmusia sp. IMI 367209]
MGTLKSSDTSLLDAPTSIRLLKWVGRNDSGIPCFSVEEHQIDHTPPYIALSYTWGNPFPEDNASYGCVNQWPVLCDGKVALISRNLHDFLQQRDPKYDDTNDAVGGGSALHYAAHRGRLETVTDLIAIGADMNSRDAMDRTPLFLAIYAEYEEVVRLLLSHRADTSLRVSASAYTEEYTPLHVAVARRNIPIIEALLDAGVSLETRLKNSLTPLHDAIWRKDPTMARFLLARGANIETRAVGTRSGETPLLTAASKADIDCVKVLVEFGADLNATLENGRTSLHEAVEEDNGLDVVRLLLGQGADVNLRTPTKGWTPLHCAVAHGSREIVLALLDAGVDVELIETEGGRTALSLACEFNRIDNIICLLDRGAAIGARWSDGYIPIHLAALRASILAVKELLARGADVNARSDAGETPLHKAVGRPGVTRKEDLDDTVLVAKLAADRLVVVKMLLDHDADVNNLDSFGLSPLHISAGSGSASTAELLLASDANLEMLPNNGIAPIFSAAVENNPEMIRLLVERGARVNLWIKGGFTPLRSALVKKAFDAATVLIELGADIHSPDRCITPHSAGVSWIVEMLLEREVEMNVQTNRGFTALNLARMGAAIECEEILLNRGALSGQMRERPAHTVSANASKQQNTEDVADDQSSPTEGEAGDHISILRVESDRTEETDYVLSEERKGELRETRLQYFWIDALSINQADELEKRTQVNLMSRIYRHATLVHVRHSKIFRSTNDRLTTNRLVALHATKYKGLESNYDPDLTIWWHLQREQHIPQSVAVLLDDELVELPTDKHKFLVTLDEWDRFASLIHRAWSRRIWFFQEICRAKHVQVSCGAQNIVWEDLYRALIILTPIRDAFANGPQIWKRISKGTTAFVCAELRSRLQPGEDYALASMETIIAWSDTSRLPLAALLLLTWDFEASDSRDKVYALLGLAKDLDEKHAIQPDYERDATDLFVEATQMLLNGFDPIDHAAESIVEVSRKDVPELKPLEILSFVYHNEFLPDDEINPKWSFPRSGIFRAHGALHEGIEGVEATPADYAPNDVNRFIYWLAIVPEEPEYDFFDTTEIEINLPPAQHGMLNWRANWDRFATTSAPAAALPINPLPTISEIQDELNDPLIRLPVLNTTAYEIEQECRAFLTPMMHYTRGRVLFRAASDNVGLGPRGAKKGDYVCGLAGAATLFVIRWVEEKEE